jgi:RND family efflux transporter MFP subunit
MKIRCKYYLIFALLLSLSLAGCNNESSDDDPISEEQEESVEVRPEVIFTIADDEPIYKYVESQGVVEASREVVLKPKISGFVEQSNIVEGARFQQGDTLLTFLDDEWAFALQEARNEYQKALNAYRIERGLRETEQNRQGTNGDSTRSDAMVRITTGLAQAELAMERAKLNLSYATITAPFSGQLATPKRIEAGTFVSAGTELGTMVDDRSVRIRFDVLEAEVNKISQSMTTELVTPGEESLQGRVSAVSPMVDPESKTGEVIVTADNRNGLLKPGMTVEGRIQIQKLEGKVRIPRATILERDGGRTLVFKLHPQNNEVEWIYVSPAAQNEEWVIVNHENIAPGDTLAVDNHFALSHLQIVEPKMQILQREEAAMEQ